MPSLPYTGLCDVDCRNLNVRGTTTVTGATTVNAPIIYNQSVTFNSTETHTSTETHSGTETHTGTETHSGVETHNGAVTFNGTTTFNDPVIVNDTLTSNTAFVSTAPIYGSLEPELFPGAPRLIVSTGAIAPHYSTLWASADSSYTLPPLANYAVGSKIRLVLLDFNIDLTFTTNAGENITAATDPAPFGPLTQMTLTGTTRPGDTLELTRSRSDAGVNLWLLTYLRSNGTLNFA